MNQPKPPPQTLQPDDERKIQVFLERASSIVLECPVLDLTHWRRLVLLAEELGLSDEELRSTVNDLRQRGVISQIDLSPPKPPPLPSQQTKPATAEQSGPEQDFSLTPPLPPPPSPPQPISLRVSSTTRSGNGTAPPPQEPSKPESVELSREERLRRYVERAQAIIAEQRGFGGRTPALLAATADELGLSEQEATKALHSPSRDPAPAPPAPPTAHGEGAGDPVGDAESDERLRDSRRWRVEGEPPPEPPAPARKPETIYRYYLGASLAQITDGIIPVLLEKKYVKHGTAVLGLAPTFARHLVIEEAAEKGLLFESKQADGDTELANRAAAAEDDALCDAKVKLFLERSVPILAQHRGINAKSRVLLNAIAAELGLSEEQVEQAIAATQFRAKTTREDAEALQQERLAGFRELVQGTLVSLPRKLLTFDVQENLCRHGEERHGIKPDLVAGVVREVCASLSIRQISEQQAREHVEQLVESKFGENARLPNDVRSRIESEGKQWGLSAEEVASIIKERTRLHDKQNQSERHFTHLALLAASIAGLMVIGFFGWVAFQDGAAKPPPPVAEIGEQPGLPTPAVVDEAQVDTTWWGEDLGYAIVVARQEISSQRLVLIRIESKEPSKRRSAYDELIGELFSEKLEDEHRDLLIRVLSLCYAREPDSPSARQILDGLLTRIPKSERDLRADGTLYPHAFLATQAGVGLVTQATEERQRAASTELRQAIGREIDASLDPPTLQQHAYDGVAARLYRLLLALITSDPSRVASIHETIETRAAEYIDATKLEKLNTEFLEVVLLEASDMWREYEPLIRSAVASENSFNTSRMLVVYEKTKDLELQTFLTDAFLERLDETPESRDVAAIASAVRKSIGVTAEDVDEERLTRFLTGADRLLAKPRVEISEPDALLAEIVTLAYHSTLGCSVAQGTAGDATFDTLSAQDPTALLTSEEPEVPATDDAPKSLEPTTFRLLNDLLQRLHPRVDSVRRFGALGSLAGMTDRVDDLAPEQAAVVAAYLLAKKRIEEHRAILTHVEELGKWKQVRLAVADRVNDVSASTQQLSEIVSKLLGREYKVSGGEAGREALRLELLRDVLADAKREDIGDQNKYHVYNDAAQALHDFYAMQAVLLRTAEWPASPVTPTAISQAMIESQGKLLLKSKLTPDLQQQVEQVDVDVRAIDYLATNDLQKLALLDRAWLRLLAVDVARKHPARSAEADAFVAELAARDRDAKHVLIQLRDGQESILRLWLLLNQAD